MMNKAAIVFFAIFTFGVFSNPANAQSCVSEESICHYSYEALNTTTHFRVHIMTKYNYWTGNSSGILTEINPEDEWDAALRANPKGVAIITAEHQLVSMLLDRGLIEKRFSANKPVASDYVVNSFNMIIYVVEQLDIRGNQLYHVHAEVNFDEPIFTMRRRLARSTITTWYGSPETVGNKKEIAGAVKNAVADVVKKISKDFDGAEKYCRIANCRSAM